MKKNLLTLFLALGLLATTSISCSSDDNSSEIVQSKSSVLKLSFKAENIKSYDNVVLELVETNSGVKTTKIVTQNTLEFPIDKGSYKISINGKVTLTSGEQMEIGGNSSIDLIQETQSLSIDLILKVFSEDFIIEEVFFTGVRTLEGKLYTGGRYFKLTNNTDKVLKTGGLLICQSEFFNTVNHNVTPNIVNSDFGVQAVLMIPKEHSKDVEPGDFIVVADMATNHKKANIPAFDLSKADYEFPNLDNPKLGQVDNPAVPNAKVIYSTMNFNMFFLNDRGAESYALARFPENVTVQTWLTEYTYDYEYLNKAGNITKKKTYRIPNSWILDGVNSSPTEKWVHNTLGASLDAGWTGVGTIDSDPSRYGKSIRRKVVGKMQNGKNMYKDTNNSTVDFMRDSEVSLASGIVH
ncbi:DUF4876 domain-containing protein [Myroides sp. N17-2]|uniref:DUF4876 domain-containing protein n=1 Tax=Myroides sp. N17-2 TaxID=2030799 RepID=UPI000EFCF9EF|nr:DUF4876 domain-containing protein [Myroides sp. N17-2]